MKNNSLNSISQEELKKHLSYNPDTGQFIRIATNKFVYKRKRGFDSYQIISLKINGVHVNFHGHTLAWIYMFGNQEKIGYVIDHANGIKGDNRIKNLRLATVSQNAQNKVKSKSNTSGYKGVGKTNTGKWKARLIHQKKYYHIGTYESPEDAYVAYKIFAKQLFGEFFRE